MGISRKIHSVGHPIEILKLGRMPQAVSLRLDVVGLRLDDPAGKSVVVDLAVVTLAVAFDGDLPVAVFSYFHPFDRLQPVDLRHEGSQLLADIGKPRIHRLGVCIKIGKQKAVEILDPHFSQANFPAIEAGNRDGIGTGAQRAVQLVALGMVWADDETGIACPL